MDRRLIHPPFEILNSAYPGPDEDPTVYWQMGAEHNSVVTDVAWECETINEEIVWMVIYLDPPKGASKSITGKWAKSKYSDIRNAAREAGRSFLILRDAPGGPDFQFI